MNGKKVEIDYDYLVVAVGAEPATFGIPGTTYHEPLHDYGIPRHLLLIDDKF